MNSHLKRFLLLFFFSNEILILVGVFYCKKKHLSDILSFQQFYGIIKMTLSDENPVYLNHFFIP